MKKDMPNCFYRVSVKAVVLDETKTKFLIVKEDSGVWDMPGGGLDWGEGVKDELSREIKEEMGLEAKWISDKPSYVVTFKDNKRDFWLINIFYETELLGLDFTPSKECVDLKFVSESDIDDYDILINVSKFAKLFFADNSSLDSAH